ncbi:hypothetical protein LTR15_003242 [Elasticomyces elasticus]|nr:hypothetical protein LTR15_003242 [Elasticomyces elasticus]
MPAKKPSHRNDPWTGLIIKPLHGAVFHVHRTHVCPKVPYIKAACDRASATHSNNTTTISFMAGARAIGAMLDYVYEGDYIDEPSNPNEDPHFQDEPMMLNFLVYELADDYNIPKLRKLALKKFKTRVRAGWVTEAFVTVARWSFGSKIRYHDLENNANIDDELRGFVVNLTITNCKILLEKNQVCRSFYAMYHSTPALHREVSAEQSRKSAAGKRKRDEVEPQVQMGVGNRYYCGWCRRTQSMADILANAQIIDLTDDSDCYVVPNVLPRESDISRCPHSNCKIGFSLKTWISRPASDLGSKLGSKRPRIDSA